MGGLWRWALVSLDGVAPSRMVGVSASVNLPLHHKVRKFSSGTGSPWWSQKRGRKTVVVVVWLLRNIQRVCIVHINKTSSCHKLETTNCWVKVTMAASSTCSDQKNWFTREGRKMRRHVIHSLMQFVLAVENLAAKPLYMGTEHFRLFFTNIRNNK